MGRNPKFGSAFVRARARARAHASAHPDLAAARKPRRAKRLRAPLLSRPPSGFHHIRVYLFPKGMRITATDGATRRFGSPAATGGGPGAAPEPRRRNPQNSAFSPEARAGRGARLIWAERHLICHRSLCRRERLAGNGRGRRAFSQYTLFILPKFGLDADANLNLLRSRSSARRGGGTTRRARGRAARARRAGRRAFRRDWRRSEGGWREDDAWSRSLPKGGGRGGAA